ncbi:DMT family transporter [Trebonia kvetii]|uniref:DMT family transporter n=1 Tax=Trebonia kvetii TaxID=2480626 RepID=A0A6P2BVH6_9ACTN|nr:EamA family transporter [Trebonia kvetii]TVZ02697.1 DMT family transporter [Trebonia kvetii]
MIMGIVLGLAAALLYGTSDFVGAVASRRIGEVRVTVIDSAAATVLAAVMLLAYGGPGPTVRAVAWGLVSGVAGGAGTLVLYRGMARGQLSVVGPVSAVGAAVVPVLAGIALGERPGLLSLAGVAVALPAITLVAASGSVRGKLAAGLPEGLAAGLAFGILFIGLAQAGHGDGLWPVATEQAGMLLVTVPLVVKSRPSLRVPLRATILPVLAGATGQAATLAYFYATHFSMLAVAAVLVSLYPGFTVLLARVLLHERFSPFQRFGLGLCALAVTAIAL